MSHKESNLEEYIDTLSSGDSNNMKSTQKTKEVNNNEVDELSKEFSEMGCVVDAMKRPPNICVENCVYEESDSERSQKNDCEEDGYSDEFEDDKSEDELEEVSKKTGAKSEASAGRETMPSIVKMSKSQSSMSSYKPPASISGRSGYGSLSVPQTRRINMSFTNNRLREIERHNHILLTKILSARNSKKSSIPPWTQPVKKPVPSAAVLRKNQQRQIDHDNMILLKKIQRAKSSALSIRR